jgi:hypothetical protein
VGRRSQRYRSTSLPYAYEQEGLDFHLDGYRVDGVSGDLELKAGETRIRIPPESDRDQWDTVELSGHIEIPESTFDRVFPPHEREEAPARLFVTVRCHETIYRDKVVVRDPPIEPGEYPVKIGLERQDLRSEVELRPYLVRTDPTDSDGNYATRRNLRVASGKIYTAVVDPDERPEEAWVDGQEVSFSDASHLPDGDKLYYLDFRNESRPKLWINTDYPRIAELLQKDGSVGAEPRMRDVILDQISYPVWSQLVLRAGAAVDEDGELEHQWQETVIQAFALEMYDTESVQDAALALRRDLEDLDTLPEVLSLLDREHQDYIDPRSQLINLMEEGLRI